MHDVTPVNFAQDIREQEVFMKEAALISKAYDLAAPLYDLLFGRILEQGRRAAISLLKPGKGTRILEVGVGTGLSLQLYPPHTRITGIDLSPEMLAKAKVRVSRKRLDHVEELLSMDATNMNFEDDSFDSVICMYLVSVVSDVGRLLQEMRRVCKPGGTLIVVNHFHTRSYLINTAEFFLRPVHRLVRFSCTLDLDAFRSACPLPLEHIQHANVMNYSTVLVFRNTPTTPT